MRKPRLQNQRRLPPRRLWSGDPMMNPRPGSSELEEWDNDVEEWMYGSPGSNVPPGGAP